MRRIGPNGRKRAGEVGGKHQNPRKNHAKRKKKTIELQGAIYTIMEGERKKNDDIIRNLGAQKWRAKKSKNKKRGAFREDQKEGRQRWN